MRPPDPTTETDDGPAAPASGARSQRAFPLAWLIAAGVALLLTVFAWRTAPWWTLDAANGGQRNLWVARIALFVVATALLRGFALVAPRLTRAHWILLGANAAWWLGWWLLNWPAMPMSDTGRTLFEARSGVVSQWFSWPYSLANIALTDVWPRASLIGALQALLMAGVMTYAADVMRRRSGGAWWPGVATCVVVAVLPATLATTVLLSRDQWFGVAHVLLALLVYDAMTLRTSDRRAWGISIALLACVLSVLRGDGIVLLFVPLVVGVIAYRRGRRQLAKATAVSLLAGIVLLFAVGPRAVDQLDEVRRYELSLRISPLAELLARDLHSREREIPPAERVSGDVYTETIVTEDRARAFNDLRRVIVPERVAQEWSSIDIPAFWYQAWSNEGLADDASWRRFKSAADQLLLDNAVAVIAQRVRTFGAAAGVAPFGFRPTPQALPAGATKDVRYPSVCPVGCPAITAMPPLPGPMRTIAPKLEATTRYDGVQLSGSFLWWNAIPAFLLLILVLFIRGPLGPEAGFAAILLLRTPLVFLAAPAAQFKYYYSVYLGGIIMLGLVIAAAIAWRRSRRVAPSDSAASEPASAIA